MNKTLKQYLVYFLDFGLRAIMPAGITLWQFGIFKDNISWFSQLQGTTIIALIFVAWATKDDVIKKLQTLENQGWYQSSKRALIWWLAFGILLWCYNFIGELIWILGSFAIGNSASIPVTSWHSKIKADNTKKDTV